MRAKLFAVFVAVATGLASVQPSPAQSPPPMPVNQMLEFYDFPTNFQSAYGYLPMACTNVQSVPLFSSANSLVVENTNLVPTYLEYRVVETNGYTNLSFSSGTLFFLFAPNWASVSQGGLGPQGQMLTISNATFATPSTTTWTSDGIPGWSFSGSGGGGGVFNTGSGGPYADFMPPLPDGQQAGYINAAGTPITASQTLSNSLQADSTYTLSIEVSGTPDYDPGTNYSVCLYAGTNLLATVTPVVPPVGSWTNLQATYTSGDYVSGGENLQVAIASTVTQLDFANVQLSQVPQAQALSISNFSFEFPVTNSYSVDVIDGWTIGGPGAAGVVNPGTAYSWIAPPPDGQQSGWINGTSPATTVSQTLSNLLQPDSTYTLTIAVTGPTASGWYPGTNYSVCLYAGTNCLASVLPVATPTNAWTNLEASYTSGDSVPSGENLQIVIAGTAGQVNFDGVQLNVSTNPGYNAYFVAGGDWRSGSSNGLFRLYADGAGSNLYFGGVGDGVNTTYASAPISWASNTLHALDVEWDSAASQIYLDGSLAGTGSGVSILPLLGTDTNGYYTNGFFIGSDNNGYEQARGGFSPMEIWDTEIGGFYTSNSWITASNYIMAQLGGGGFGPMFMGPGPSGALQTFTYVTNYLEYTNFWLTITTDTETDTEALVTIQQTQSNLTYQILTNSVLDTNLADWGVWETVVASNSVIAAPPFPIGTNNMFFASQLVLITGTNQIADWWQMEYFGELNVNPYADPDGDGLCNYSEYILGTNPTNAYSITTNHNDAQALFLAYTNDTTTRLWLFETNGPGTNAVTLTLSNTLVGSNYQIFSKNLAATNNPWRVETNFIGTNTATQIIIQLAGRSLDFIGGDGEDPDGDGLPSGYEVLATHTDPLLADTGNTGTPDGYKDPDGDSYSNLEEYQNGTDPLVFNEPPGLASVVGDYVSGTSGNVDYTWQPAQGGVLGYIISEDIGGTWVNEATNSATQLSYVADTDELGVETIYAGGNSAASYGWSLAGGPAALSCAVVNGPGGMPYLVIPQFPATVTNIQVGVTMGWASYPVDDYPSVRYDQSGGIFGYLDGSNYTFNVAISRFTNGVAELTDSELPPYGYYGISLAAAGQNGKETDLGDSFSCYRMPFLDASTQMKQNIAFQLRVADANSLQYELDNYSSGWGTDLGYPTSYVYSDCFLTDHGSDWWEGPYTLYRNQFEPIEDNYFFNNLVYNPSLLNTNGTLDTGFSPEDDFSGYIYYGALPLAFSFPTYSYVVNSNSASVPALLSSGSTPYVGYHSTYLDPYELDNYYYGSSLGTNIFGLAYSSILQTNTSFYVGTVQPTLSTVGYYFARENVDPTPGYLDGSFSNGITTPSLILGSVGQPMYIAGYAKQAVLNGYTNVFAYLGQYFTNAFVMGNGTNTTNIAGIVSEYGDFFPTIPGHVALMTKPDPAQTNIQGTCPIDVIRLSLDVNHDGTMDESFTGPDNTSAERPFSFWANDNCDRWTNDNFDNIQVEDDVSQAVNPGTQFVEPDYNYTNSLGERAIPCPRDLEDYARLWVSGISSNVLASLPSGSTVTLSWQNNSGVTIDLFQAADTNGGIGYQTNLVTASNQLAPSLYVQRLGPGQSIQLNATNFSNGWAGNYFIWCGVAPGSDQLNLTVCDGSSNILAQSSQYIQIQDIKQMYERWTVGDIGESSVGIFAKVTPATNADLAQDNFSPGYPNTPFQYSYDPQIDTNDTYILFVHGYNMQSWEKDRYAETAFKRLYWQGYQGRFGSFRWPTYPIGENFDDSERQSWLSGTGLCNKLTTLNSYYPGKVYLLAHSLGNVAAGEALRLAGTNQVVNTYVASQAALSAHAYDNTIPNDASSYYTPISADSTGHYYTNTSPPYFNGSAGAGTYVNFCNTNDWALMGDSLLTGHPGWLLDQSEKIAPTNFFFTIGGVSLGGYKYTTPSALHPSGYYYQNDPLIAYRNLLFTNDTYEIFSQAAQSYSRALGAEAQTPHSFNSLLSVDLFGEPYNFGGQHVGHSLQFRSDNMTTATYWGQLLSTFQIQP